MKKYTAAETLDALAQAVVEKGADYVYPNEDRIYATTKIDSLGVCAYTTATGEPSCIAGNVLHRLTPGLYKAIEEQERAARETGNLGEHLPGAISSIPTVTDMFTEAAVAALTAAQASQDVGTTWGTAYRAARDAALLYPEA